MSQAGGDLEEQHQWQGRLSTVLTWTLPLKRGRPPLGHPSPLPLRSNVVTLSLQTIPEQSAPRVTLPSVKTLPTALLIWRPQLLVTGEPSNLV